MGKIKYFIVSILIASILVAGGVLIYINWNAIKGSIDGSKYYTEENLNDAYNQGYDDALKNQEEMSAQIDYYKGIVDEYYITIQNLQKENADYKNNNALLQSKVDDLTETKTANEQTIAKLESDIADNKIIIDGLLSDKTELENKVKNLTALKQENENTISELNADIANLNTRIEELENSDGNKASEIASLKIEKQNLENEVERLELDSANKTNQINSLNTQISTLQSNIDSLQTINQNNLNTITELNNKIISLNSQISDLTLQINNNSSVVNGLNQKIAELQKSISYYETYIASLESETQVVATFEFAGSVYNVQIVNKNSKVSVVDPTSTDYVIFNYWTVDGEQVDLSTYTLTENTKFIADVTYKQLVKFTVDSEEENSQFVIRDGFAVAPTNPTKDGYEFDGWTINGVDVINVSEYEISQDTTFIAKFTKLYNVTFIYEDDTLSSQEVRNGEYAEYVSADSTTYKVFNGWTVNGSIVDVNTYKIVADTTFVASITYKYDVVFKVDNSNVKTQIVTLNSYATAPTNPTKDGYEFDGWTINGSDIVNVGSYKITANTTFFAKFTKLFNVKFVSDGITISNQTIRDGETFVKPSNPLKIGFEFDGWTVNNIIVSLDDYSLTSDVTFIAKFTELYSVKFIVDGESISNQTVRADSTFSAPTEPTKDGYEFNGWTIDGTTVIDLSSYNLTGDVEFIAKFTALAGLFADDGSQIMSWDELIENNYFSVSDDGVLSKGSNLDRTLISGNLYIPEGIVTIGNECFRGFSILTSIVLPNSLLNIESVAFYDCSGLKTLNLPNNLQSIASNSFVNLKNLEILYYNVINFENYLFAFTNLGVNVSNGTKVIIGDEVEFIPNNFMNGFLTNCNVSEIVIGKNVKTIGYNAFYYLRSLSSIYIPSCVDNFNFYIDDDGKDFTTGAFYGCNNLTIYLEISEDAENFADYWNIYNVKGTSSNKIYSYCSVKYGYTYEEYLVETGALL